MFHGYQTDAKPFMEKWPGLVFPSYHEGMAITRLETGAMGRQLNTSNIHGCLEAVGEGSNGYLDEAKNAESLLGQLEKFLGLLSEERKGMGRASREVVQARFDKKKVVGKT